MKSFSKIDGGTLIESIVAISITSFIIIIFAASYTIVATNKYLKHKNLAINLAAEQIEALYNIPVSEMTNVTDGDFIDVAYNKGSWNVSAAIDAPSLPNVYVLNMPSSLTTGITGMNIIPGFDYDDFTFETSIKTLSASPSNWEAGALFRLHDKNNYYRVYYNSTNLYLDKNVNGTETVLAWKPKTFDEDIWYTLKIVTSANDIEVYINDILELSATDSASSFSSGKISLLGMNSVNAQFDEVSITSGPSVKWAFDTDSVGSTPERWKRFGINDLPTGTEKLSIEDYQGTYTDIKDVTVRIEWVERSTIKSVELKTLITE